MHIPLLLGSLLIGSPAMGAEKPAPQPVRIATETLVMQPGDAAAFARSLDHPTTFAPLQGSHEFSGSLLVRAKNPRAAARIAPLVSAKSKYVEEYVLTIPDGLNESTLASMLMATGDYIFAQPNWMLFPASTVPNDPAFPTSWQHIRLQSTDAWDISTGSSSVIIAVCDTGVDLDHPDLESSLVSGYNSWTNTAQVDGGNVAPSSGHGTIVMGCAGAIGNNGFGPVGVGWNFSLMPIRVTSNAGAASSFSLGDGARWAADNGAKIVNISFSGALSASNTILARDLKAMGALLFYAAGNDNINLPGSRPDFVIVSASTTSDTKWTSSNFGSAISVAAPGAGVTSTTNGGGFGNSSGTSFASPIAAGVGAMIFSMNPDFGPDDVQEILYSSVDDIGDPGFDNIFGNGRVNTFNAVTQAQTYIPRTPIPLAESFESASWTDLFTALIGSPTMTADPSAPDGASVLEMTTGDIIESTPLAGRTVLVGNYSISMLVKTQDTEDGESIEIQYRNESGAWVSLVTMPSFGVDSNGYIRAQASLGTNFDFAYHGVTIRVLTHGSDPSDIWFIDDLRIEPDAPAAAEFPFTDSFDSGALSSTKWDLIETTAPIGASGEVIGLDISNAVQAETINLNARDLSTTSGFINFFALSPDEINDDALTIEYINIFGNWATLDTIDASQLSPSLQGFSYEIPLLGFSDPFRLRLSDTATAGGFFVDDISIGEDPIIFGCSAADLAEPFDALDIFDVLAFLDAFNAADPAADFTADGNYDIFDVLGFLDSFNAGCP